MVHMEKRIASFATLFVSDMLVLLISVMLAHFIRDNILPHFLLRFKIVPRYSLSHYLGYFYIGLACASVFAYERLYTKRFPFWEEVKILSKSSTIFFCILFILGFLTRKQTQFSRTILIATWLISLIFFPISRYLIKMLLIRIGLWNKSLLIIGANDLGATILENIKKNPTLGYTKLGFINKDPQDIGKEIQGVKIVGVISQLNDVAKSNNSRDIIIALSDLTREELLQLISTAENLSETVWVVPRFGDIITSGVEIENLGRIYALNIKKNLSKPWNLLIKNLYDICAAVIIIIILLPVLALISVAIKLDSPGPVLFIQKRIGKQKKAFKLLKFRSMYIDADHRLEKYFKNDPMAIEEWQRYKKLKNHDPRVTRVGKIIRRYSLDELPQLFNVLQGKMSLAGPRPYITEEIEKQDAFMTIIGRVKPGITGLWQTSGRSELSFEERIALDKFYVHNWSLWLDIVILLKSIRVPFSKKGAY